VNPLPVFHWSSIETWSNLYYRWSKDFLEAGKKRQRSIRVRIDLVT